MRPKARNVSKTVGLFGLTIDVLAIIQSVVNNVIEQMNSKRYNKALQHFQLYVWLFGYQTEELKGHIFDDVSKAFNNWTKFNNIKIYTYSSGIYLTQKMLFACSVKGNLTPVSSLIVCFVNQINR